MSDFLQAMEARDREGAPVQPVLFGFIAALGVAALGVALTAEAASGVFSGRSAIIQVALGVWLTVLVAGLGVGGVLSWAVLWRQRRGWIVPVVLGYAALALIVTAPGAVAAGWLIDNGRQKELALDEIAKTIHRVEIGDLEKLRDARPRARGEPGEVERVIKESALAMVRAEDAYDAEIKATGFDEIRRRGILQANLDQLSEAVRRERAAAAVYRGTIRQRREALRASVEATGAATALARPGEEGLGEMLARMSAAQDRELALRDQVSALYQDQLATLRAHPGAWRRQGPLIVVYDRRVYDELMERQRRMSDLNSRAYRAGAGMPEAPAANPWK